MAATALTGARHRPRASRTTRRAANSLVTRVAHRGRRRSSSRVDSTCTRRRRHLLHQHDGDTEKTCGPRRVTCLTNGHGLFRATRQFGPAPPAEYFSSRYRAILVGDGFTMEGVDRDRKQHGAACGCRLGRPHDHPDRDAGGPTATPPATRKTSRGRERTRRAGEGSPPSNIPTLSFPMLLLMGPVYRLGVRAVRRL